MRLLIAFLFASLLLASCSSSDNSDSIVGEISALKVTVTASVIDEGNGITGVDDIIEYTISIENTGDATLTSISLASSLHDFLNNSLELDTSPVFVSASLGSSMESIQIGEIATYNTSFTITQNEVDADGFRYSVTVEAMTPQNVSLSDVSDNGDDSDGNLENDETEINIEFDPLVITEYHRLDFSGEVRYKYSFDSNGRIAKVVNLLDSNTSYTSNFDSENRLINITISDSENTPIESIDISYTTESKIQSVGDRTFSYNPDILNYVPVNGYTLPVNGNNFYIDDTSYYAGPEPTLEIPEQEFSFGYYVEDMNGQVTYACTDHQVIRNLSDELNTYCYSHILWHFSNNLLESYGTYDSPSYPEYDMLTNPLFQGSTNIVNIAPFLSQYSLLLNKNFFSINNRNGIPAFGENPESIEFTYEFNALGLPTESTAQNYFLGVLESESLYSKYYYQGDEIPD